jgi:hypothetical protein
MIELLLPCGFDTLEYSWVKGTIGICTLADYSVAKKHQQCSVVVHCRLALEQPGFDMETSADRWSELYACYMAATSRIFINCWYTLLILFVEGAGRVSKSAAAVAMFWLTLGVIPRSEIAETKPPYVCPGCFIHTYSNNMINRCHV